MPPEGYESITVKTEEHKALVELVDNEDGFESIREFIGASVLSYGKANDGAISPDTLDALKDE